MANMTQDFVGRVERLPLPPSETNSLMPVYEAVSNSLHAVEDRFTDRAHLDGLVTVEVLREEAEGEEPPVTGFRVTDNGVGLDEANYRSFLRPDSRHKQGRGGKGVGRLGWLKVFDGIRVDSTFGDAASPGGRSFDFRLAEEEQVQEHHGRPGAPAGPGTVVLLRDFREAFRGRCPVGADTIKRRLAAHFLPMVVSEQGIRIRVVDGSEGVNLNEFYREHVREVRTDEVTVELDDGPQVLRIQHLRVAKAMKPENACNRLFLCGHGRTVEENVIDTSLGLRLLRAEDVYVGCVSGEYLDDHVNAERTGFSLPAEVLQRIRQAMLGRVNDFLGEYVGEQRAAKRSTAKALLREYPQFLFIGREIDKFVEGLKPGATSPEDVFMEMARQRYRRQRTVISLERQITQRGEVNIRELMDRYEAMVTTDQKGVLAEYVVRRKAVLDLLDSLQAYEDAEARKPYREDALHRLVCPMKTDSDRLNYEDHNLWLLDDRLAFFAYFNSDKELRSYVNNASLDRPDITFFYDTVSAWMGEGEASNTVVLVEFKRPGRDDYSGNDNPVRQLTDTCSSCAPPTD